MTTFLQTLETFFWNVLNRPGLSDIADILIVAIIIYELLMLTRDTRGSAVLKGLAMLLVIVGRGAGNPHSVHQFQHLRHGFFDSAVYRDN